MSPENQLLRRIRAEYHEMPGLRLTLPQACRMWHLEPASCLGLLEALVEEGNLRRTRDGAYVALPMIRHRAAKAPLRPSHSDGVRTRNIA